MKTFEYLPLDNGNENKALSPNIWKKSVEKFKLLRVNPLVIIIINLLVVFLVLMVLDAGKMDKITVTNENVMNLLYKWNSTNEPLYYFAFLLEIVYIWDSLVQSIVKKPQGAMK